MLITISAKPCTVTLSFTDDLNYLHNYILSSLLQFVSCWISSSQRAKSLKWTRHVLDGSVGWAHSNPAERGKCNVTAVLTPRDTWISAKPRSLDVALGSERKHAPSTPRLHFPLSLLIVQYWNTYLNSISVALSVPRQSRLLCCYSSSFVAHSNWCVASADCASLSDGVELGDLAVAWRASQRCLSKAACDCAPKMARFACEWAACSGSVSGGKKRQWDGVREWEGGWGGEEVDCTVCNLLCHLFGFLWMVFS